MATVNTPAMAMKMVGRGSQYAWGDRDSTGNYLDGANDYRLNLPADAPAKNFWSLVVYDPQTRSELQTGQPFPSKNNAKGGLTTNPDGSVDLYFGPRAAGRLRGQLDPNGARQGLVLHPAPLRPTGPWFDQTWRPGEIELIADHTS